MNNPAKETGSSSDTLDVIMRLHAANRGAELRRSIFSLVCQEYRPLNIHLVTQRFTDDDIAEVTECVSPILKLDSTVGFKVLNHILPEPTDARSALINMGIRHASGRYLTFLDYDDVIYHQAYTHLIRELHDSHCAIAFGKIVLKTIDVFNDALICNDRRDVFKGASFFDLFSQNFCPIHSFVIDRHVTNGDVLWFDESLDKNEDYDFLIRFCAANASSFTLKDVVVGDYYAKNDGSNTIMLESNSSEERFRAWARAEEFIERRRRETVVSKEVQLSLGIPALDRTMTVRRLLDWLGSRSQH